MNRRRRAIALIAGYALVATLSAMPAAAYSLAGGSMLCDPHQEEAVTFEGRGAKLREKDLGQVHVDLPASAKGKAKPSFTATVPVYFHVITDGAAGDLTDSQISAQIAVLNDTFGGGEGGADTGFSFRLTGVTRTNDATWFAVASGAERAMKQALRQGGNDALNVYSTSGAAYLGWAYLPSITDTSKAYLDGIVLDWETIPGVSTTYAGRYDLGETLTHEAGHWFNLEHTFFGGCNAKGDFVDDTPPQKTPTSGCPIGKDTCRAPGLDPIHNYMDYSYDSCYTEFTDGQSQRMRDAWLYYRAS
jgi:pregnancy-associated plasma protein-A